jgi:hypothetical protein
MSLASLIEDPLRGKTSLGRVVWVYGLLGSLVYSAFGLLLDPGKAMIALPVIAYLYYSGALVLAI